MEKHGNEIVLKLEGEHKSDFMLDRLASDNIDKTNASQIITSTIEKLQSREIYWKCTGKILVLPGMSKVICLKFN
jgi:hypothetical protein